MSKIKVPMQLRIEETQLEHSFRDPYERNINIVLTPQRVAHSFTASHFSQAESMDFVHRTFYKYIKQFQQVDIQTLYAIEHLLRSARVDNAFDMLTLNEQLLPMLYKVIAQADPYNYELEIIK